MYKDNIKIRVKLCGNCNPSYDANILLKCIKEKNPDIDYVFSEDEYYDLYMIINGCHVSCVSFPDINCPKILISGYSVNKRDIKEDKLVSYINEIIKNNIMR